MLLNVQLFQNTENIKSHVPTMDMEMKYCVHGNAAHKTFITSYKHLSGSTFKTSQMFSAITFVLKQK